MNWHALSTLATTMALALGAGALAGCTPEAGQVAATVDGEEIPEAIVTDYVESYIDSLGYNTEQWAQYLGLENTTAADFRTGVVDYYVDYLVYEHKARDLGIEITDEQIDAAVLNAREQLGRDDDGWVSYLAGQGYTEDTYRATVAYSLLVSAIQDQELAEPEPTDEQRHEFADAHILTYDAKHVLGIEFAADDYGKAESLLAEILAADDPIAAFKTHIDASTDDDLVERGGDLGWSCLTSYGSDWSEVVGDLEEGKVYPYVYQADDACYLLLCDEGYAPAYYQDIDAALEHMPKAIREVYDEDFERWLYTQAVEAYTDKLRSEAKVVVNDMPSGLPYDVEPIAPPDESDE